MNREVTAVGEVPLSLTDVGGFYLSPYGTIPILPFPNKGRNLDLYLKEKR